MEDNESQLLLLRERLKKIKSYRDLYQFVIHLRSDLENNPSGWRNRLLPEYLSAIAAYIESDEISSFDPDGRMPEEKVWKLYGEILLAARNGGNAE